MRYAAVYRDQIKAQNTLKTELLRRSSLRLFFFVNLQKKKSLARIHNYITLAQIYHYILAFDPCVPITCSWQWSRAAVIIAVIRNIHRGANEYSLIESQKQVNWYPFQLANLVCFAIERVPVSVAFFVSGLVIFLIINIADGENPVAKSVGKM